MKVVLKFHSTLTGGVDENIKNLKSNKTNYDQYYYMSKQTTFADILAKNSTLPSRTEWTCRNRYLTLKFLTLEKTLTNKN